MAKNTKSFFPVISLNNRFINEPAFIILGYLLLAVVIANSNRSPLQVGLAIILGVIGSGSSTVAFLFPRPHDLDIVERAALSACLSMAIGGLLGFALARSPWGLNIWPFIILSGVYNFVCFLLTWYRRRNLGNDEMIIRLDCQEFLSFWETDRSLSSRLITVVLIVFLLSGAVVFALNLRQPSMDPPMTEFFLLGQSGQTEEYPYTGRPGETQNIAYGIKNLENATTSYQVKVYIQGEEVGIAQPVYIDADEIYMSRIEFYLRDTQSGQTKVEFVLYRKGEPYRFLHLWIDIVTP
jgi:uncharacterized membrane protein